MINCYNHDLFDKKKIPLGWFNNLQSADRKLIERINGYIFSPFSIQPWSESEKDFIKNNLWLDD
ncbi:hypothetical protein L6272_01400, partial [Microgenomates group bacterium]|nr:hypothetical protein [Microgenomates group bacterium]